MIYHPSSDVDEEGMSVLKKHQRSKVLFESESREDEVKSDPEDSLEHQIAGGDC